MNSTGVIGHASLMNETTTCHSHTHSQAVQSSSQSGVMT